jgi:hypothetical protein
MEGLRRAGLGVDFCGRIEGGVKFAVDNRRSFGYRSDVVTAVIILMEPDCYTRGFKGLFRASGGWLQTKCLWLV